MNVAKRRLYTFLSTYIRLHPDYPHIGVMAGLHIRPNQLSRVDDPHTNTPWFLEEPDEQFLIYRRIHEQSGAGAEAWLILSSSDDLIIKKRRHSMKGYYDMWGYVKEVTFDFR